MLTNNYDPGTDQMFFVFLVVDCVAFSGYQLFCRVENVVIFLRGYLNFMNY
jgi:hypothetical protein